MPIFEILISLFESVEWLIVDESDKLFEAGERGFRDQLATIYKACTAAQVRRAMFSATFAFDVQEWCKLNLDNVVTITVGTRNTAVESVQQELVFVGEEYGKLVAFRDMIQKVRVPVCSGLKYVFFVLWVKSFFHFEWTVVLTLGLWFSG